MTGNGVTLNIWLEATQACLNHAGEAFISDEALYTYSALAGIGLGFLAWWQGKAHHIEDYPRSLFALSLVLFPFVLVATLQLADVRETLYETDLAAGCTLAVLTPLWIIAIGFFISGVSKIRFDRENDLLAFVEGSPKTSCLHILGGTQRPPSPSISVPIRDQPLGPIALTAQETGAILSGVSISPSSSPSPSPSS